MRTRRRSAKTSASLLAISTDLVMLGVEAQMVIGQRMAMLTFDGTTARKEAQPMMTKKVKAAGVAAVTLATGSPPHKVVWDYR